MLHGRSHEVGQLAHALNRLAEGVGSATMLHGESGIGKSALLDVAIEGARQRSLRMLSATGVQSEAQLSFAGLHQLLEPELDRAAGLPPRLRETLLGAFGLVQGGAPDLFLTGLATLELIGDLCAEGPVLLTIDDAQWLDQPSCAALSFVARRIDTTPALLVITARSAHATGFDDVGLADLHVGPLDEVAAAAVLDDRSPELDASVRRRILDEAGGNPLALTELPTSLTTDQLRHEPFPAGPVPLTTRLERAFAARATGLDPEARALLLIAAADDRGLVADVMSATETMLGAEPSPAALEVSVDAGLVAVVGDVVRFRHPLIRSAIYQSATVVQRHAAHGALAVTLADQPHRRAWHRAAATFGPDEAAAADLDDVANDARRRGALAVTAAAFERAADLSADPGRRGARILAAADAAFDLGRSDLGLRLIPEADSDDLAVGDRSRLRWLADVHGAGRRAAVPPSAIAGIAEDMRRNGHTDLAWQLLLEFAMSCFWQRTDAQVGSAVASAAEQIAGPDDEPALLDILAHAQPMERGAHAVARLATMVTEESDPRELRHLGLAASAVWAPDLALPFLTAAVNGLRHQGRLGLLAQTLSGQAWAAMHVGQEPIAIAAAGEAERFALETGQPEWAAHARLAQAAIAAERGDIAATEELISVAERLPVSRDVTLVPPLAAFVRGRGAVAHQQYEAGIDHLRRLLDAGDPIYQPHIGAWGLSDLVEACSRTGAPAAASRYLAELEALAAGTSGTLLRATAGYARPFVAADEDAEDLFVHAVEQDLARWPCYRGRMLLSYGRWLRRQRRVAESRTPLRAARQTFDVLAFPALADTARQELRASGETSGRRSGQPWDRLTPQELTIAQLAAQGLTNREIGAKLYISHRTVGFHLHRIYPKLGVTSRNQLDPRSLSESADAIA
jgi:DNA-binding CsgD family transcriptional regulator